VPSTKSKPKPRARRKISDLRSQTFEFEAIGTAWEIEIGADAPVAKKAMRSVHARIEEFSKNYSRFRPDSLVTQMSKKSGRYVLPDDARPMLDLYHELYDLTRGRMTPLIGSVLEEAGYDAGYTLRPKTLHRPLSWDECLGYDFPDLTVKQPAMLDFGAMGKGYLVDIVGTVLRGYGIKEFVINAGGDILHGGSNPVQVGLEHPGDTTQAIGVAEFKNRALCGSAGNRRAWAGFTHIIDPDTLASPHDIKAVWVVAESALLADALTTVLYFTTPAALLKRYNFSYGIVSGDLSLTYSPDFPAEFFA